jgi:hypothetical protein
MSEPDGFFRSNSGSPDNLLSNESELSIVAAVLERRPIKEGAYLGVGPEQNFTYIVAIRPRIAFITDIRRGNLHLHLLYKALFEMSADRAEFVSRLFTRQRPPALNAKSTAWDLMFAYRSADPGDEADFQSNLKAVFSHLTAKRGLPLGAEDLQGIEYVYRNFYRFGPDIHYTSSIGNGRLGGNTYAQIMGSMDETAMYRSYLAEEERFAFVKEMQQKNLIIPIVGDFAGPKALRAVAAFLKEKNTTVSAFYVSNVEQYLETNRVWPLFCQNFSAMPLNADSVFIRPGEAVRRGLASILAETARCKK